ncbi:dienelactone hydrolase family protein [Fodinisporobacter ferrooxydans]|uniref:Dienelactone hydrolase family protein n=1 Tax=Fodinisporobacter ferrooxydans TaxID=2901836 RepID=A0ABY4CQ97_9BACL|nr:dienelactone hydrolase family protein [Alicyclobacillaceae bacterium MYW30-H2]
MTLHAEWIDYGTNNQFRAFLAKPANNSHTLPAIIVIQEIWGVDHHIQDVTKRFAQAGYLAIAPDLFAEGGERPDALQPDRIEGIKAFLESLPPTAWGSEEQREAALAKLPDPKQTELRETFRTLFGDVLAKIDHYAGQLQETSMFLKNQHEVTKNQPIGSVGFCMGGALSALLASKDPNIHAAVIFYGNAPKPEAISHIQCPVLGFYGELDKRITDAVPAFAAAMKEAGKSYEYHVYPKAHHAFFNDTRASYNPTAARDAFARTLGFFNEQLR